MLQGCNGQFQLKPDNPWRSDPKERAPKYRTALGEYDAILPSYPDNPKLFLDIERLKEKAFIIDGHPCLLLTEGFFKAIAGCANKIPTIALLGVEMGLTSKQADPQEKRYVVPALEKLARAGFGFIIGFDADCADNKNVVRAQRTLARQLKTI